MGNAQSATAAHHPPHNRLSKPKTNTNSPSLAPKVVHSPSSVSSRYAHLTSRERQQIKTQLLSPVEKDFGHTGSPDGDVDVSELATHLQRRLSSDSGTNSLSCFGNVRGPSATKLTSLPGSKVSLVSTNQAVDLETAIKIVQEVKKTASPEDLAALHQALQCPAPSPSPRQSPAPEPVLSRRTSLINRSTSSLLRRRSLNTTPGVATRNSGIEGIRRTWNSWKTPKLDAEEEAKWRVESMGKSPLTRLAALDLAEEGCSSPTPRAQTPGELDYAHLGSFRLGSLQITNGPASPTPSAKFRRRRSNPNLFSEEDYFAPAEPYDTPITMKPTKRRRPGRSKSTIEPPTPPLHRKSLLTDEVRRAKTMSRCDSPQKVQAQDRTSLDDSEPEPVRRLRVMNKSADTLAEALANSPAMLAEGPTDSGDYDEGFVADERQSFQDEAFRLLTGAIFNEPLPMLTLLDSAEQPQVSMVSKTSKGIFNRPPPTTTDSGYSSGGSLRMVQGEISDEGTASTFEKPSVLADAPRSGSSDSDASSSLHTFEQVAGISSLEKASLPSPASYSVAFSSSALQVPHAAVSQPSSPIRHVMNMRSLECDSPKSPLSTMSQTSVDSKHSGQRRLQKRRPSVQELPIIQSCGPIPEGTVPSVPANIIQNFSRRLSEAPNMDCLTQTYPSIDHVKAEAASSVAADSIRSSSPLSTLEPQGEDCKRSATGQPTSSRSGIRRSLSLLRGFSKTKKLEREMEQSRQEKEATPFALDLGTIAMSLGQSPYDAAMVPTRRMSMTAPTHPHQLGHALPRTRSMVNMGMDAETAIEFARMRSKDRAISRPTMPQRPRSFHAIYRRIPHDLNEEVPEVPPVPRLPVVEANKLPVPCDVSECVQPVEPIEQHAPIETHSSRSASFLPRTTGRGPVVAEIIEKYDQHGQAIPQAAVHDWQSHAQLWSQRRKFIGEDLRRRSEESQARSLALEQPTMPQVPAQYTGPGIRQLHSYASRRSTHSSHHRGESSSHAPSKLVWP